MDPTATIAESSPLPPRDDPLADAHCLKCGYSLRGLPENRCPECGIVFDPDALTTSFVPRWPALLKWVVLAEAIGLACAAVRPGMIVVQIIRRGLTGQLPQELIWLQTSTAALAIAAAILGGVTAIGLHFRRDWARRAFVAMRLLQVGAWFVPLMIVWSWQRHSIGFTLASPLSTLPLVTALVCSVLPTMILILWITTGLRRHSLGRGSSSLPIPVDSRRYRKRGDWLLLMSLLFGCTGLMSIGLATNAVSKLLSSETSTVSEPHMIAILLKGTIAIAITIWSFCSVVRIWRNPLLVRRLLLILVGLIWASVLIEFFVQQASLRNAFASWQHDLLWLLGDSLLWLLPPTVLFLHAWLGQRSEDMHDVAPTPIDTAGVRIEADRSG